MTIAQPGVKTAVNQQRTADLLNATFNTPVQGTTELQVIEPEVITAEPVVTTLGVTDKQIDQLGEKYASRMASTSKDILSSVKASEAGEFGTQLNSLITTAKRMDPDRMRRKGPIGFIRNIFSDTKEKMFAEYATVETQMATLVQEIAKTADLQRRRISDLDQMFKDNEQAYQGLKQDEENAAKLLAVMETEVSEMEAWARSNPNIDAFKAQEIQDFRAKYYRLEKKLDDIRRVVQLTVMAAPQIRMMQGSARTLITKFNDIQRLTIPAWQQAFSMYIIQQEQQHAAALSKAATDMTNEALVKSAQMMGKTAVEIAAQNQRGIVDIETLKVVHQELITSADEVRRVEAEGRTARAAALPELQNLEKELVQRFIGNDSK